MIWACNSTCYSYCCVFKLLLLQFAFFHIQLEVGGGGQDIHTITHINCPCAVILLTFSWWRLATFISGCNDTRARVSTEGFYNIRSLSQRDPFKLTLKIAHSCFMEVALLKYKQNSLWPRHFWLCLQIKSQDVYIRCSCFRILMAKWTCFWCLSHINVWWTVKKLKGTSALL